jgi:hypothetical protein
MDSPARLEILNPSRWVWESVQPDCLGEGALIRVRQQFGSAAYFVAANRTGLFVRITDPDWALPIAMNLLGWRLRDFRRGEGELSFPRAFRLPVILLRFLFANSAETSVGSRLVFRRICPLAMHAVSSYLSFGSHDE